MENFINKELAFGGILTEVEHRISRQGKGWASFIIEDYLDSYEFRIFGEDYLKYKHLIEENKILNLFSEKREAALVTSPFAIDFKISSALEISFT